MRKLLCLPILFFGLFSCSSDETNKIINTDLTGEWQLTEAYISAGGPQYWVDVENGEELIFFENGLFNSNRFLECTTGTFSTEQNELLLNYDCNGFESEFENEEGFITYDLNFELDYFIVTPTSGPICTEGCSYKYRKK